MASRDVRPIILILLATLPLLAPGAHALPSCGDAADWTVGSFHVVQAAHRSQVWQEDNALAGLQTETCQMAGVVHPPDAFVAQVVPRDLGILGLCSFLIVHQCL